MYSPDNNMIKRSSILIKRPYHKLYKAVQRVCEKCGFLSLLSLSEAHNLLY